MTTAPLEDPRLTRLTQLGLALPEVTVSVQSDYADFRVRKKVFAYFLHNHHGDGIVSVCFKAAPGENKVWVNRDPARCYLPPHIGARGWFGWRLDLGSINWREVKNLLELSYDLAASKALAHARERQSGSAINMTIQKTKSPTLKPARTAAATKPGPLEDAETQLASFLAKFTPAMAALAAAAMAKLTRRYPHALRMVYDNYNGLVIGFVPTERPSEAIFSLAVMADHASLCFLQGGPALPDTDKLLRGSGNTARHLRLENAATLDRPAVKTLLTLAVERAKVPFDSATNGRLIIRSISAKQRPRRPVGKK